MIADMAAGTNNAATTAVRVLRSALSATPAAAARSAGVTPKRLRQATAGLVPRGRCAKMAADLVNGHRQPPIAWDNTQQQQWMAVLKRRVCPPAVVRCAAAVADRSDDRPAAAVFVAGTAGWSARTDLNNLVAPPPSLVRVNAGATDHWVRVATVVEHARSLPPAVFERLAHDPDSIVRHAVAARAGGPRHLLEMYASDEETQGGLVLNALCPPDLLARTDYRDNQVLRRSLAQNPACPSELLEELIGDEDEHIDIYVASNPICSPRLLQELTYHHDDAVAEAAANNLQNRHASQQR